MIAFIFWALVLLGCYYSIMRGGWEGKFAAVATLTASLVTLVVHQETPWVSMQVAVLYTDIAYMFALYLVALRSRYYWVLWMCAFQLAGVATHLPGFLFSGIVSDIYEGLQGFWSIPVIVAMVFGIYNQQQKNKGQRRSHFDHINTHG